MLPLRHSNNMKYNYSKYYQKLINTLIFLKDSEATLLKLTLLNNLKIC